MKKRAKKLGRLTCSARSTFASITFGLPRRLGFQSMPKRNTSKSLDHNTATLLLRLLFGFRCSCRAPLRLHLDVVLLLCFGTRTLKKEHGDINKGGTGYESLTWNFSRSWVFLFSCSCSLVIKSFICIHNVAPLLLKMEPESRDCFSTYRSFIAL